MPHSFTPIQWIWRNLKDISLSVLSHYTHFFTHTQEYQAMLSDHITGGCRMREIRKFSSHKGCTLSLARVGENAGAYVSFLPWKLLQSITFLWGIQWIEKLNRKEFTRTQQIGIPPDSRQKCSPKSAHVIIFKSEWNWFVFHHTLGERGKIPVGYALTHSAVQTNKVLCYNKTVAYYDLRE